MPTVQIDADHFLWIFMVTAGMLLSGWIWFWWVVMKKQESPSQILFESSFLQNLTVIGVVCTSGLLALIGVIKGDLEATLLTGIVGYVLGSIKALKTDRSSV
jgi:hypothetical protein